VQDPIQFMVRPAASLTLWLETVGVTLIAVVLGFWSRPGDPFFLAAEFPWLIFASTLIALRYGVVPGVVSVGILIASWLLAHEYGVIAGDFPKLHFLGTLILVMICGQFCSIWQTRLRRLEYVYRQLDGRIGTLTRRHYLLRLSHDRLEQDLIGRPMTLRSALAEVRRLIAEGGGQALPGAPQLMRLLVQSCQLEVAALHRAAAGSIEPSPAARVGEPGPLHSDDPLVRACLESGTLAHVQAPNVGAARSAYLAVAPARDGEGHTLAVLVVEQMPFFSLHEENLQTLSVLLGYYADGIGRIAAGQVIQVLLPSCPLAFAEEIVRLHRIWLAVRVPTTLIGLEFGNHPERDVYADTLRRNIRDVDMVWEIRQGSGLVFVVMLPLSGRAAVEGYLARIEGVLRDKFAKTLDAARVISYVAQLDDERPAVTLIQLLEHCGVKS
jgi:polysaccharide biosynthesis protein PelD